METISSFIKKQTETLTDANERLDRKYQLQNELYEYLEELSAEICDECPIIVRHCYETLCRESSEGQWPDLKLEYLPKELAEKNESDRLIVHLPDGLKIILCTLPSIQEDDYEPLSENVLSCFFQVKAQSPTDEAKEKVDDLLSKLEEFIGSINDDDDIEVSPATSEIIFNTDAVSLYETISQMLDEVELLY